MSGIKRVRKENIINAALEILRESSLDDVQARTIAKKLNCSTQPIFYQFKNMQELKSKLIDEVIKIYSKYMTVDGKAPLPYKEVGKGYIRFAKEEPKLFQLMFMSQSNLNDNDFMDNDKITFEEIRKHISNATGLISRDEVNSFHLKMWIFTHGIATMLATKTCEFSDEQISNMLTEEFKALMLLEKMKGENKNE